ncbi:unnamed protein product [Adineta steineri]|uniref:Uncharacterized protein n=1 Tax=Adineta steineri TaxID=433720 RepID=A0A816CUE8_9BILA|nr:unnamed protein product [Adineta steineri]CAF1627865.1 unnamed protein product [Adineta steineri]
MNSSSKSCEENRKLYSPWSSRVHPLIFLPVWTVEFVLVIMMLKGFIYFISTTNGLTRLSGYIMFFAVLFATLLLIYRVVEYLMDMKVSRC